MTPKPERSRRRTFLKGFLLSVVVVQAGFWWAVRLPTPDVEVPVPGEVTRSGARVELGDSFLERRDGYWFFMHRGSPVDIGMEHAALGGFMIQRVDEAMFEDFGNRLPLPLQLVLPPTLMWRYRHMARHLPPEQLEELWGFASTYADRHGFPFSSYRRGIYYHALHDITQELVGNPWVDPAVAGACTGFAASGEASVDGHLFVGRNFDFEVFPLFDSEKVVHVYARDGAIPVLSISWMAMAGVVTGMNAEGIWLSINSARSEGTNRKGPPVALRARTILEQARSLEDVERLLAEQDPMVSDIYLVADGKTGEAAVIERGQTRMARRGLSDSGTLTAANHLLTEEFAGDEEDEGLRTWSSTLARHLRMEELVNEELLSPARAQAILRDRRAPGGDELPLGNRNAIDALIATHSSFADLTDRIVWVSTAPHTQGSYRPVDLLLELQMAGVDVTPWRKSLPEGARAWERLGPERDRVAEALATTGSPISGLDGGETPVIWKPDPPAPPADLPPGDLLLSGEWDVLQRHRSFLDDADGYLDDDEHLRALDMAERAEELVPRSPRAVWLQGEAHRLAGQDDEARADFVRYMQAFPSYGPDWGRARDWLEENGGLPQVERADTR